MSYLYFVKYYQSYVFLIKYGTLWLKTGAGGYSWGIFSQFFFPGVFFLFFLGGVWYFFEGFVSGAFIFWAGEVQSGK